MRGSGAAGAARSWFPPGPLVASPSNHEQGGGRSGAPQADGWFD